ncbi:hypothetical protein [Blastochloris sulfoviridis]|uniref:Uncharacterized protein n=1 Tax=Blastochloris sulfoviridis TaxID=50712 RepID=A0A5M6HN30_9HYPH|nr:hypothetical protein [Blastochloris sulfoviridis]KAA5597250.1 hypothetical protein F1193_14680 [Blastochloris sulfoviridis]
MTDKETKGLANPRTIEDAEAKMIDLLYEMVDLASIVISNAKKDGNISAHMVNSLNSFLANNHITLPELMERKRQANNFIPSQADRANHRSEPDGDYVVGYHPTFGLPIFADDADGEELTRQ